MRGNGWLSNINSATDFDFFWLISKHSHIQYSNEWINEWMSYPYDLAASWGNTF